MVRASQNLRPRKIPLVGDSTDQDQENRGGNPVKALSLSSWKFEKAGSARSEEAQKGVDPMTYRLIFHSSSCNLPLPVRAHFAPSRLMY